MHRAEPTTEEEPSDDGRWARFVRWVLHQLGLERRKPTDLSADLVRLGRQIRESGRKVIAFIPATRDAPTTRICHELCLALGRITDAPVGWLDVSANFVDDARDLAGDSAIEDDGDFRTALVEGVRWLAPHRPAPEGTRFQMVAILLNHARTITEPPLDYILVDLAGFFRTGELLGTLEHLDGVVIVGRTGFTQRGDLVRLYKDIPERLNLGVLLTQ